MDPNKSYTGDEIEKGKLFMQLVGPMLDVFANMPCDTLKKLPGFTEDTYDMFKLMKNKLKLLQEENINEIETPESNHIENGQSTNEINMNITSNNETIRVRDNSNDISTNHQPNNEVNNEVEDRVADNDLADYSVQLDVVYNNNDIDLQNNDISNITETIQGVNDNDLTAESEMEICDDLNNECAAGNKNNSKQDESVTEINSECSVAHGSNDEMEFTNELANVGVNDDNVEAMDASDEARHSPLPTFDDVEDKKWHQFLDKLKLYEDYLNEDDLNADETGITEHINKRSRLSPATTDAVSGTVLRDNATPSCSTDVSIEVPVHPNSSLCRTDVQSNNDPQHVLQKVFKFEKFKEGQEKVIRDVVSDKNNCLIIMPASSGKSLCYQLPAKMSDGVTVVICQSKLLIHDQLEMLKSVDMKVEHLVIRTVNVPETENLRIYTDLESDQPEIKLLYMEPEKLKNIKCMNILMSLHDRKKISRFVIDDAQYIPMFFEDRPAYRKLGETLRKFHDVPITVLASSIRTSARADIMKKLKIPDGWKEYRISLDVPYLSYNVTDKTEQCFENVAEMISTDYMGKSCIVYCLSVEDTFEMADILKDKGVTAKAYNNKMDANSRKAVYNEWHSDSNFVICAKSKFGLGKVKPGVKLVVHLGLPDSLEAYSQQVARAGADTVRCVLYYRASDLKTHIQKHTKDQKNQQANSSDVTDKEIQIYHMDEFCKNKTKCRRLQILEYFDDLQKVTCGDTRALCDYCRQT